MHDPKTLPEIIGRVAPMPKSDQADGDGAIPFGGEVPDDGDFVKGWWKEGED